jgi:putative transposase
VEALDQVAQMRGYPEAIRVDNGGEFCGKEMDAWAYRNGVKLLFSRPGTPTDNGYIESFNGKLRDECLNQHLFTTIKDAKEKLEAWRIDYNQNRPHSALGNLTPAEYERLHTNKKPRESHS